jgi:hypothetical protein
LTSDADVPSDVNQLGDASGEHTASNQTSRDSDVHGAGVSNETPHVVYDPLPSSYSTARQKKALRRAARLKSAPPWVKKIPWLISWPYMLVRRHDPDYEEHYEQWEGQVRNNYDDRDH